MRSDNDATGEVRRTSETWARPGRAAFPERPTTRFAPSVTGVLHLGHVLNAVATWSLARALGGRVVLRLEDHDRSRYRPEHEQAILDDLDWLGLEPDLGRTDELRAGSSPYRQSDDDAPYESALTRLREAGTVFACRCRRRDLVGGDAEGAEPRHVAPCTEESRRDGDAGLRLAIGRGVERFEDLVLGAQAQEPAHQCGDLLLVDRRGQWTYHFAVVVDDARHGVDLVVRGRDLLESTGRQLVLQRLLGLPRPAYLHHPLIGDESGRKLSKSDGAAGIATLREAGESPAAVLGLAAWLGGLQDERRPLPARDLAAFGERLLR